MKCFLFIFISTFLISSCSSKDSSQVLAKEKCLSYGPEKIHLKGFLTSKSFPGPPNYEDVQKGDEEEIYWFVKAAPFCVDAGIDFSKSIAQSEVQLVLDDFDFYKKRRELLDKYVVVKGTLFQQMTGHHKTEVLINVESLELALND